MVYRTLSLSDAQNASARLEQRGIAAHIATESGPKDPLAPSFIRVSVDNRRLDAARRAIAAWRAETPR